MRLSPNVCCCPQIVQWFELLHHNINVVVVSFVTASKSFTVIVHFCILNCPLKLSPNFFCLLSNILKLLNILVNYEVRSLDSNIVNFHVKFSLFLLHEVYELLFFFFQRSSLSIYDGLCIVGWTIQSPLFIVVFFVRELVLEIFQNFVDLHSELNLSV